VAFLVYTDEDFVTQLCDSVCVLQVFSILQLFIKLDSVRSGLAADTIAILCHIMRTSPANINIVEEILLDDNDKDASEAHSELWRLISHHNPLIQSRSLRVFTYLCLKSEKAKTEILNKSRSRIWKVLRRAAISPEIVVRRASTFALDVLNYKSIAPDKSNSTASGCQSQDCLVASSIPNESQEESRKQRSVESPFNEDAKTIAEFTSLHSGPLDDTSR
ncbi:Serine/threonine-protein kinase fused, partial [Orchesella cincta]